MGVYAISNPTNYRINPECRRMGGRKGGADGVADGA